MDLLSVDVFSQFNSAKLDFDEFQFWIFWLSSIRLSFVSAIWYKAVCSSVNKDFWFLLLQLDNPQTGRGSFSHRGRKTNAITTAINRNLARFFCFVLCAGSREWRLGRSSPVGPDRVLGAAAMNKYCNPQLKHHVLDDDVVVDRACWKTATRSHAFAHGLAARRYTFVTWIRGNVYYTTRGSRVRARCQLFLNKQLQ